MKRPAVLLSLLLPVACSTADPPLEPCEVGEQACAIDHAFGTYSIEAGGEIDGICMSWTLDNDEPLWVNAVSTQNDGLIHHSNWFFVPDDKYPEDGHWPCWENEFNERTAAVQGGVLYAQSTQVEQEEQRFLPGTAVRIPARSKIVAYTHVLNATGAAADTEIRVQLDTLPQSEVTTLLAPFRFNYGALEIPPMASSEFTGSCVVRDIFETVMKRPLALRLHWVLPHFHALGTSFRLAQVGGDRDGETLFSIDDAYGEPLGHAFDEPFDVAADGGTGLAFTCGYNNPRTEEVGFGIGDQEMCVMLGFAESGFLFDGAVDVTEEVAEIDGVMRGTGPCKVLGLPYGDAE